MKFTIQGELPDLNTYINAERGNKYAGASMKKKATDKVVWSIKESGCKDKFGGFYIGITYYCKDRRKDKDNIAFAKKFIFDGLQKAGTIKNDGWDNVLGWYENFEISKDNPRIEFSLWF